MKNKIKHSLVLSMLTLGITITAAAQELSSIPWQDHEWDKSAFQDYNYEDKNTEKGMQGKFKSFYKDPFIWTVSQEFADMYGMPQEWVDPTLKGALALAWRTTNIGKTMCGHGGNPNACWPAFTCQLDVYVDNKAPIPWHTADMQDFDFYGLSSYSYLPYRWPETRQTKYLDNKRLDERPKPVYFQRISYPSQIKGGDLVFFDRQFAPGIALLSFKDVCPSASKAIQEELPSRLGFTTKKEIENSQGSPRNFAHIIEFPLTFIRKIAKKHEEDEAIARQANTAYQQIMQRYAPNAGVPATHGVNND